MKKALILLIFPVILLLGCKDEPTPPEELPPGYQHDIPWPSLADTPWPMNHHDPQSTGRSKYLGPQMGILAGVIPCRSMEGGVVIGSNSTVYTNSRYELIAMNYEGVIKWKDTIGVEITTVPLVLADGTIISADGLFTLLAVNPDGLVKWKYKTKSYIRVLSVNVDKNGNIYFLEDSKPATLHVLNKEGVLQWEVSDERFLSTIDSAPVFSPDGTILYIQGSIVYVLALNIKSKSIEWTFGNNILKTSPIVDSQGNIYVYPNFQVNGKNHFYSIKPNGELRWVFEYSGFPEISDNTEPTIDKNGNLYFAYDSIYSLSYEGKLRWKKGFEEGRNLSPLVCDAMNNIYVGICVSQDYQIIKCFSDSGAEKYSLTINTERALGTSPAITENGLMFYPTFRSLNIICIK